MPPLLIFVPPPFKTDYAQSRQQVKSLTTPSAIKPMKDILDAHAGNELDELLQKEPYSFQYTEQCISDWLCAFMKRLGRLEPPSLMTRESSKRRRAHESHVGQLRQARRKLREDVEDPLPAVKAVAKLATKKRRGEMYEKKQSAKQLKFSQDDDYDSDGAVAAGAINDADDSDDEEIDDPENITLSAVPEKAKIPTKRAKTPPSKRRASSQSPKRRKRWTEEERMAVRTGAIKFGAGRWVEIKDHYHNILRSRTPINIKDCYRTMVKQGVIQIDDKKKGRKEKENKEGDKEKEDKVGENEDDDEEDKDKEEEDDEDDQEEEDQEGKEDDDQEEEDQEEEQEEDEDADNTV